MSSASQVLLSVQGATVAFGGVRAVDEVSLDVHAGEILGLVGPNGAGKSTLFGAVAGAVPLRAGRVMFDGQLLSGRKPDRISHMGVARTFQKVRLFHSMSAYENVLVAARQRNGSTRADAATLRALDTVGYALDPATPISALALADRKRVEIARALAAGPRLVLLDEMMSGLTPGETDELVGAIKRLPSEGVTVMLVEHVLPIVRRLCDRLVVLHHGRLIAEGAPDVVLARDDVIEAWLGRGSDHAGTDVAEGRQG